jgi:hypothetical protein
LSWDFKYLGPHDLRIHLEDGSHSYPERGEHSFFYRTFACFTEIIASEFSHRTGPCSAPRSLTTLDRIYTDIPTAVLNEIRPANSAVLDLASPTCPSDHAPMRAQLSLLPLSPPPDLAPASSPSAPTSSPDPAPVSSPSPPSPPPPHLLPLPLFSLRLRLPLGTRAHC